MLTFRSGQMAALAAISEAGTIDRAVAHLRNCIPEACAAMSEIKLREAISWGRRRSRLYGIEREVDFFRYLNLMFMFGFGFDTSADYPWASRTLNANGAPSARMDLLMDHAMLHCSRQGASQ